MVLVESGLNSEQVSLMRHIYFTFKIAFDTIDTKTCGLNSKGRLNFKWSLWQNFTVLWLCRKLLAYRNTLKSIPGSNQY